MRKPQESFEHRGLTVNIHQDENAEGPDSWGDDGLFLVADHREFYVTDPNDKERRWTSQYGIAEFLKDHEKTHHIFPLEAYIHSGVHLSIVGEGNYLDRRWDVSCVGAVLASKKEWRMRKSARKAVISFVGEWNKYLSGDVWGYEITKDGKHLDSCWGFYGLEYCKEEAKKAAENAADLVKKLEDETLVAEAMP